MCCLYGINKKWKFVDNVRSWNQFKQRKSCGVPDFRGKFVVAFCRFPKTVRKPKANERHITCDNSTLRAFEAQQLKLYAIYCEMRTRDTRPHIIIMGKKWHFCDRGNKGIACVHTSEMVAYGSFHLRKIQFTAITCYDKSVSVCVCVPCVSRPHPVPANSVTTIHFFCLFAASILVLFATFCTVFFSIVKRVFLFVKNFFFVPIIVNIKTRTAHGASSVCVWKDFGSFFFARFFLWP